MPNSVRNKFGVRFCFSLTILRLTENLPGIATNKVRHTFGFGLVDLMTPGKALAFFSLLARFRTVRTPHNRQVEDRRRPRSNPSRPTICLAIHRLINLRAPDCSQGLGDVFSVGIGVVFRYSWADSINFGEFTWQHHKQLIILNTKMKNGTHWDEKLA